MTAHRNTASGGHPWATCVYGDRRWFVSPFHLIIIILLYLMFHFSPGKTLPDTLRSEQTMNNAPLHHTGRRNISLTFQTHFLSITFLGTGLYVPLAAVYHRPLCTIISGCYVPSVAAMYLAAMYHSYSYAPSTVGYLRVQSWHRLCL